MRLEPDGWYGYTKQACEQLGLLYVRMHGLDFRAARLAAVTGPNRRAVGSASLFTSLIAEKAAKGEPYVIEVTEDTSYPVVYVKDAVDALLKLAFSPVAKSRVYNVASGNVVVRETVAYVKKKLPQAVFTFAPVEDIMRVVSGYKEWNIACGLAEKEIGWRALYGVERMVDDIIEHVHPP
jgi:UDP-glucuronate 4-epimerase